MRVALVNDSQYPRQAGAVRTWSRRLVRGLSDHRYHLITVAGVPERPVPLLAGDNRAGTVVRLDGPPVGPTHGPPLVQHRRTATHAAVLLCRGMLDDSPHSQAMFRSALRRMAAIGADGTHPLHGVPLGAVLYDAWKAGGRSLPPATPEAAQQAALLIERAVRPLAAHLPEVDLYHTVNSGLSTMVGLAAWWRTGRPYVLTEYSRYLHDPFLDRAGDHPAVRALLLRFLRGLSRLGYTEAAVLAPPGERMRRWATQHGVPEERLRLVRPGLDPRSAMPLIGEPTEPVLAWVGPDDERPAILAAHERIRRTVPEARLIGTGYGPDGPWPPGVSFIGPVGRRRVLYTMAQLILVSDNDPGMPYPLIEALMCGRPAVCTQASGLAESATGATVVPTGDPAALATACVTLLRDPGLRREVARTARRNAREVFGLAAMLDGYREAYRRAARLGGVAADPGGAGLVTLPPSPARPAPRGPDRGTRPT